MTALAGVELESLVSEPDALTTRPHVALSQRSMRGRVTIFYIIVN